MITRRQFLDLSIKTGAIALAAYPSLARAWGVLPVVAGSDQPWKGWDEINEVDIARDNVLCVKYESTAAGSNEVGSCTGLNATDRTFTQAGNIAGATGSGVEVGRQMDDVDDEWSLTANARNICASNAMTIIHKVNLDQINEEHFLLDWLNGGDTLQWTIDSVTNKLTVDAATNLGLAAADEVNLALSASTIYWLAIACDGNSPTWMGVATSKPNSKSDFDATFDGSTICTWTDLSASRNDVFHNNGGNFLDGKVYYTILAGRYLF